MVAAGGCARLVYQVLDVVDTFCRCLAHKLGPGPHKLVLHIYKEDVLLKMQPDPVQRPGEEIGGHMVFEVCCR